MNERVNPNLREIKFCREGKAESIKRGFAVSINFRPIRKFPFSAPSYWGFLTSLLRRLRKSHFNIACFPVPPNINPVDAIRRCGYGLVGDRQAREQSFSRRMGSGFYPRFHIYYSIQENKIVGLIP